MFKFLHVSISQFRFHYFPISQFPLPLMVFERPTNFIVVTNFEENQLFLDGIRHKKQAQTKPCAALEKIETEFPNTSTPVRMRRAPCIQHGYESFIHRHAILNW